MHIGTKSQRKACYFFTMMMVIAVGLVGGFVPESAWARIFFIAGLCANAFLFMHHLITALRAPLGKAAGPSAVV